MSTFYRHTLDCPACGVATEVNLAKGLHITRLPEVRAEILAGTFQVFDCPGSPSDCLTQLPRTLRCSPSSSEPTRRCCTRSITGGFQAVRQPHPSTGVLKGQVPNSNVTTLVPGVACNARDGESRAAGQNHRG